MEGLGIVVASPIAESTDDAKSKNKGKSKAKTAGRELISDAHLKLKGGVHYGLLGRNGTGKSSTRQCFKRYYRITVDTALQRS